MDLYGSMGTSFLGMMPNVISLLKDCIMRAQFLRERELIKERFLSQKSIPKDFLSLQR
jgi:hypothetical protein